MRISPRFLIGVPFALALLLSGCGTTEPTTDASAATTAPVNYDNICLLENPNIKSKMLVEAITNGFVNAGANVKELPVNTSPTACEFVIAYDVQVTNSVVTGVSFQTYEHGTPRDRISGRAPEGRGLTVDGVQGFLKTMLESLKDRAKRDTTQQVEMHEKEVKKTNEFTFQRERSNKPAGMFQSFRNDD